MSCNDTDLACLPAENNHLTCNLAIFNYSELEGDAHWVDISDKTNVHIPGSSGMTE